MDTVQMESLLEYQKLERTAFYLQTRSTTKDSQLVCFFTAQCYASTLLAVVVYLSICLSIRQSHTSIGSKCLNVGKNATC